MAKEPPLMDLPVMRALLNRSKKAPINCALAVGPENRGLLLLHRKRLPRTLAKDLKKDVPEAKNTRWGTASVDLDDNPRLVKLTLNKVAPGVARRMVKTLKGTGYNKVEVSLDESQTDQP